MGDLQLSRAGMAEADDVSALIAGYPYKETQRRFQGIEQALLAARLSETARKDLAVSGNAAWLVRSGSRPVAAAILAPNEWHSSFFGLPMAKLDTFLNYADPEGAAALLLDEIQAQARRWERPHISVRIDGADYRNLQLLEAAGFRLIDCSLKLGARLQNVPPPPPSGQPRVRLYSNSDREAVLALSAGAHPHNHFFNEPRFARKDVEALFRAWVQRCLDGLARHVYVAIRADGQLAGFVTYLVNEGLNQALGLRLVVLDYLVVDPDARGRGVGRALVSRSLAELSDRYDQLELRTSQHNYPALIFYGNLGLRAFASDYILHWHGD